MLTPEGLIAALEISGYDFVYESTEYGVKLLYYIISSNLKKVSIKLCENWWEIEIDTRGLKYFSKECMTSRWTFHEIVRVRRGWEWINKHRCYTALTACRTIAKYWREKKKHQEIRRRFEEWACRPYGPVFWAGYNEIEKLNKSFICP